MRSGLLQHKITVQSTTESQDAYGAVSNSWGTYCQRWAQITPQTGREYYASNQVNAELGYKFLVRYDSSTKAITPKMRISWASRTFNINAVSHLGTDRQMIELLATEAL